MWHESKGAVAGDGALVHLTCCGTLVILIKSFGEFILYFISFFNFIFIKKRRKKKQCCKIFVVFVLPYFYLCCRNPFLGSLLQESIPSGLET